MKFNMPEGVFIEKLVVSRCIGVDEDTARRAIILLATQLDCKVETVIENLTLLANPNNLLEAIKVNPEEG